MNKSFPASPRSLRRHLERIRIPLQELGIAYHVKGKTSKGRVIEFTKYGEPDAGVSAPESQLPF